MGFLYLLHLDEECYPGEESSQCNLSKLEQGQIEVLLLAGLLDSNCHSTVELGIKSSFSTSQVNNTVIKQQQRKKEEKSIINLSYHIEGILAGTGTREKRIRCLMQVALPSHFCEKLLGQVLFKIQVNFRISCVNKIGVTLFLYFSQKEMVLTYMSH